MTKTQEVRDDDRAAYEVLKKAIDRLLEVEVTVENYDCVDGSSPCVSCSLAEAILGLERVLKEFGQLSGVKP